MGHYPIIYVTSIAGILACGGLVIFAAVDWVRQRRRGLNAVGGDLQS